MPFWWFRGLIVWLKASRKRRDKVKRVVTIVTYHGYYDIHIILGI